MQPRMLFLKLILGAMVALAGISVTNRAVGPCQESAVWASVGEGRLVQACRFGSAWYENLRYADGGPAWYVPLKKSLQSELSARHRGKHGNSMD